MWIRIGPMRDVRHLKAESEHAWNAMKDAVEAFKAHYRKDDNPSKGSADHAE